MMRPDAKVEKVYIYPKPVDFRKSIDGLAALVELEGNRVARRIKSIWRTSPSGLIVKTEKPFQKGRKVLITRIRTPVF